MRLSDLEFRTLFPRAKPGSEAWVWIVRGKTMLRRLGLWDRRSGNKAAEHVRRREQTRRDAEWEQASTEPDGDAASLRDVLL